MSWPNWLPILAGYAIRRLDSAQGVWQISNFALRYLLEIRALHVMPVNSVVGWLEFEHVEADHGGDESRRDTASRVDRND